MKNRTTKLISILAGAIALSAISMAKPIQVDKDLKIYTKVEGVSGNLDSIGSDTLNNLMTFWAEAFRKHYPNVKIQIEGKGSSTAPPALIEGTSQLGPMSRAMKNKEVDQFEEHYGFAPVKIGVALDSLAVFVNKDNPIDALSLQEIDAIFSKNRKGGLEDNIVTWREAGVKGPLARRPISLYGRNSASGTYGYFKSKALFKGDYKDTVKEQPGSASVVLGITEDLAGAGYSGIGYKTSGVKAIALSQKKGGRAYEPNYTNVLNGKYPLARMLYIYIVKEPNKQIDPVILEFLKFIQSKEGQEIVVKDGYLPLPAKVAKKQLSLLR